jgi:hypothetical protein
MTIAVDEGTYRKRVVRAEIRPLRIFGRKQARVQAPDEPTTGGDDQSRGVVRRAQDWFGGGQEGERSHFAQWATYTTRTHRRAGLQVPHFATVKPLFCRRLPHPSPPLRRMPPRILPKKLVAGGTSFDPTLRSENARTVRGCTNHREAV